PWLTSSPWSAAASSATASATFAPPVSGPDHRDVRRRLRNSTGGATRSPPHDRGRFLASVTALRDWISPARVARHALEVVAVRVAAQRRRRGRLANAGGEPSQQARPVGAVPHRGDLLAGVDQPADLAEVAADHGGVQLAVG
ncbi:MAG TPA: hypothetical protein VFT22_04730, partial [Kofleriaceae bacterium]|nr:hypothetical protein [Kofleriaceae bacterium]